LQRSRATTRKADDTLAPERTWIVTSFQSNETPKTLQRARPSHSGCNRTPSWAGSLSLGRSGDLCTRYDNVTIL
ncbi:MAG: hypothetical protein WA117_26650, partial [Verrucomicrobiia bacterium]